MIAQPEVPIRDRIQAIIDTLTKEEQYDDEVGLHFWKVGDEQIESGVCTNGARRIVDQFPGAVVYGYPLNPVDHPKCVAAWCLGHDFALIEDRYLVDWWGAHVEGTSNAIYDLEDPTDKAQTDILYLPRSAWTVTYENKRDTTCLT